MLSIVFNLLDNGKDGIVVVVEMGSADAQICSDVRNSDFRKWLGLHGSENSVADAFPSSVLIHDSPLENLQSDSGLFEANGRSKPADIPR